MLRHATCPLWPPRRQRVPEEITTPRLRQVLILLDANERRSQPGPPDHPLHGQELLYFITTAIDTIIMFMGCTETVERQRAMNQLSNRVFARKATVQEAISLWRYYMKECLLLDPYLLGIGLPTTSVMMGLDYLSGTYTESIPLALLFGSCSSRLLAVVTDVLIFFAAVYLTPNWVRRDLHAWIMVSALSRACEVALTRKVILGLEILVMLVLGIFVRVVVSYGLTKGSRINRRARRH
jgi:hypothetical protein